MFKKKVVFIVIACVLIAMIAVIVLPMLFNNVKSESNYSLYIKDGELHFTDFSENEPWQVTTRLITKEDPDNTALNNSIYPVGVYSQLSSNGELLFYIDEYNSESNGVSLYYRNAKQPEQQPVKIDSDVVYYSISDTGKRVTYTKGKEGVLYQYDLTDKVEIDNQVKSFDVSNDGEKICYLTNAGEMYFKCDGKDKEKIDSDVSDISYINNSFNTVYYLKGESLCKKVEGKETKNIASGVSAVLKVYESGEVYYTKSKDEEIKLIDYIEDDMKSADAAMKEPEYPDVKDYKSDDYQETMNRYTAAVEEYNKAMEAYNDKLARDSWREELAEKTMTNFRYALFYNNGKKEIELTTAYGENYAIADNKPIIIFKNRNQSTVKKAKFSEFKYDTNIESMVTRALEASYEKSIAVKGGVTTIAQTDAQNFVIDSKGKNVYFLDDIDEETNNSNLYKMRIFCNKVLKPKVYDSDVSCYLDSLRMCGDKAMYYKGVDELYINKQKIDSNVDSKHASFYADSNTILYMVDMNRDDNFGTLKIFKNGKALKIADKVHSYQVTPNGEVVYLYDYNNDSQKGSLSLYRNGNVEKIDDNVVAIIPMNKLKVRGDDLNEFTCLVR